MDNDKNATNTSTPIRLNKGFHDFILPPFARAKWDWCQEHDVIRPRFLVLASVYRLAGRPQTPTLNIKNQDSTRTFRVPIRHLILCHGTPTSYLPGGGGPVPCSAPSSSAIQAKHYDDDPPATGEYYSKGHSHVLFPRNPGQGFQIEYSVLTQLRHVYMHTPFRK